MKPDNGLGFILYQVALNEQPAVAVLANRTLYVSSTLITRPRHFSVAYCLLLLGSSLRFSSDYGGG